MLQSAGKGTTFLELSSSALGAHFVPVPPLGEQVVIAEYLGEACRRADDLITKKRALIDRFREKRSALISHVVTRGLPPDAARAAGLHPHLNLRPSGIEWIGNIPERWEIVRLGRKIVLQRGVDITKDEQHEGDIPVVSSGGISSFHDRALASGPGVVVGRKGTVGTVHYIDRAFWPHDTTLWVREFRANHERYVFYKLSSMDLASFDTGSANPTVNRNLVHPTIVSWPPLHEQPVLADYLDVETAKIDRMIGTIEEAIARLQEYRSALITAAVSGEIDLCVPTVASKPVVLVAAG